MLLSKGLITEKLVRNLLSWRHSGFNVHVGEKVRPDNEEATERLALVISSARTPGSGEDDALFRRAHRHLPFKVEARTET